MVAGEQHDTAADGEVVVQVVACHRKGLMH